MKIEVLIPCYDGKVCVSTSHSLQHEFFVAQQVGIQMNVRYLPGMSLVHAARNMLVHQFLYETDSDKAVFVDADVGWKAGSMVHLVSHKEHFVAAGCRRRKEPEDYAINWLDTGVEQDERTKLIEIETIGMAFTAITRKAFQMFRDKTPELAFSFEGKQMHGFYECPIRNGEQIGEDVAFCRKWREIGQKVWLDPRHWITHSDGIKTYGGCVGTWLNERVAQTKEAAE